MSSSHTHPDSRLLQHPQGPSLQTLEHPVLFPGSLSTPSTSSGRGSCYFSPSLLGPSPPLPDFSGFHLSAHSQCCMHPHCPLCACVCLLASSKQNKFLKVDIITQWSTKSASSLRHRLWVPLLSSGLCFVPLKLQRPGFSCFRPPSPLTAPHRYPVNPSTLSELHSDGGLL